MIYTDLAGRRWTIAYDENNRVVVCNHATGEIEYPLLDSSGCACFMFPDSIPPGVKHLAQSLLHNRRE